MDWVRFGSICSINSIGSEIELTQSSVFDFVRLPESIELNPRIEFDWIRLSSISESLIDYAGLKTSFLIWLIGTTVEPRFNEPLYNEVLGLKNDIFQPSNSEMYGKEPRHNELSI